MSDDMGSPEGSLARYRALLAERPDYFRDPADSPIAILTADQDIVAAQSEEAARRKLNDLSFPDVRVGVLASLSTTGSLISIRLISTATATMKNWSVLSWDHGAVIALGFAVAFISAAIVVGAFVTVGDEVTIMQNVTIGRKLETPDRAPRIGRGVLISSGATVLGDSTSHKSDPFDHFGIR